MATRDIELCNQALVKLGTKMIANFTDDEVGMLCGFLLSPSLDSYSVMYTWTWNETVTSLTPIADPDPAPIYFDYSFNLPTDYLQLRYIADYDTLMRITDYDVRRKNVYCNSDKIVIRYAARIDAVDLPYICDDSFSSYLAHRLAPSLEDASKAQQMWQEFLQKGQSAFMEDAKQRESSLGEDYTPDLR